MDKVFFARRVFRSISQDIYENLALENYLFENLKENEELLFLWNNSDAVVIGRFQDPEIECNITALRQDCIPLARRQSGGGTVWHDRGNLCFTFMSPKSNFNKSKNLCMIQEALLRARIPVEINERHDILLMGKKISGSAFREKADRAFHHGTLLVSSQLEKLSYYLKPEKEKKESRHIRSVSSPVTRIIDIEPAISIKDIENILASTFSTEPVETISPEQVRTKALFSDYLEQMRSRAWIYGPGSSL